MSENNSVIMPKKVAMEYCFSEFYCYGTNDRNFSAKKAGGRYLSCFLREHTWKVVTC